MFSQTAAFVSIKSNFHYQRVKIYLIVNENKGHCIIAVSEKTKSKKLKPILEVED